MDKEYFNKIIKQTNDVIDSIIDKGHKSVCICGSSRFSDLMAVVKWELEKKDVMATGLHLLPKWYTDNANWTESHHGAEQENVASILDKIHLRKIDVYDCVLVVNPQNYIGERTSIEIDYAKEHSKEVFYWET